MNYEYLTTTEKQQIINDIRASRPTPSQIIAAAESEHWRSTVTAAIGLNDEPDAFVAPDTTQAAAEHAALDALEATLWQ